jgi:hypothetical protein
MMSVTGIFQQPSLEGTDHFANLNRPDSRRYSRR